MPILVFSLAQIVGILLGAAALAYLVLAIGAVRCGHCGLHPRPAQGPLSLPRDAPRPAELDQRMGQPVRVGRNTRGDRRDLPPSGARHRQPRAAPRGVACGRSRDLGRFVVRRQSRWRRRGPRHREHGLCAAHGGIRRALGSGGAGGRVRPSRRPVRPVATARPWRFAVEARQRDHHGRAKSRHLAVLGAVAAMAAAATGRLWLSSEDRACRPGARAADRCRLHPARLRRCRRRSSRPARTSARACRGR